MKNIFFKNCRKKLNFLKNHKGVSLVEMMITVFIFSIVVAGFYSLLEVGGNSWRTQSVRMELQQELRKAENQMSNDLYGTGAGAITDVLADGNIYTGITFKKAIGTSGGITEWGSDYIMYQLGGINSNELQRIEGSSIEIIAQNISSLLITRKVSAPNIIEVSLQAEKTPVKGEKVMSSLSFDVQMRN